jgi:hypothetical protein
MYRSKSFTVHELLDFYRPFQLVMYRVVLYTAKYIFWCADCEIVTSAKCAKCIDNETFID